MATGMAPLTSVAVWGPELRDRKPEGPLGQFGSMLKGVSLTEGHQSGSGGAGQLLAAGSADGTIYVWTADPDATLDEFGWQPASISHHLQVGPGGDISPSHPMHFEPPSPKSNGTLGLADIACHVTQRTMKPRLLRCVALHDVASNMRQALLLNNMALYDVTNDIRPALAAGDDGDRAVVPRGRCGAAGGRQGGGVIHNKHPTDVASAPPPPPPPWGSFTTGTPPTLSLLLLLRALHEHSHPRSVMLRPQSSVSVCVCVLPEAD